jgi:hypothetical protein
MSWPSPIWVERPWLDSVHSVVTAVEWVFQKIRTAIDDIIKYVSVLFEWEDIRRTKEVFHNLIKRYLESQIQGINEVRNTLDNKLDEAMAKVRDWAELPSLSALGETMVSPVSRSAFGPDAKPYRGFTPSVAPLRKQRLQTVGAG